MRPLPPDRLYRHADLSKLSFETTADLARLPGLAEQSRARDAIMFGTGIDARGFNIFVIGSPSARMTSSVRALLEDAARARPEPLDWVYVNNFSAPHRPKALSLPAGRAPAFQKAVHDLIEDLKVSLPAIFEGEDYQKRRSAIEQSIRSKGEGAFAEFQQKAEANHLAVLRTPMGFALAPTKDGKIVTPEEFHGWPEAEQQAVRSAIAAMEKELEQTLRGVPRLEKELSDAVRALDRETAQFTMVQPVEEVKSSFSDLPPVAEHVEAIHADLLENIQLLISPENREESSRSQVFVGGPFDRYEVNVLVTQGEHAEGAPVVEEVHPTLSNLIGRIEYLSLQGALLTNFRLIRAGALHHANGGTILIDARALLTEPFSWTALKRALMQQQIVIEDVARFMGLTTTVSLEPDPIPLTLKVVLFGDRLLYYLLQALDPDIGQHFKVLADFDDDVPRSASSEEMLAQLIGSLVARERFAPLDRKAVARTIEHAARLAEDAAKLTLLGERLRDLLAEAGYWAAQEKRSVVSEGDVEKAIAQQIMRASRLEERGRETILRDIALIETTGSRTGQINGLSVLTLGDYSFGTPTRITCRVRPGTGKVVDIEREVELGGPLHSKGVLILVGFLAGRYALDTPMSLYASLVFEQSYGGVEGDSASSAELYALLSILAETPLRQDLAVTGSVNQHGVVQAIGGVNEKIEGFFDLCNARGLSGTQGVLIPKANVQHLMLRSDVVDACEAGRFAIFPIETIDDGIALLTSLEAGVRDADGRYPAGSVNGRVEERLRQFAKVRQSLGGGTFDGDGE